MPAQGKKIAAPQIVQPLLTPLMNVSSHHWWLVNYVTWFGAQSVSEQLQHCNI